MKKIDLTLNNINELKTELLLNWTNLESTHLAKHSTSKIRIYQIDEKYLDANFIQLKKVRDQLRKYKIRQIQLLCYLPYSKANFHADGPTNRYIIPIITNDKCINLELAADEKSGDYISKMNQFNLMQDTFLYNETAYTNWFNEKNINNISISIPENECYYIGPAIHAHINFSIEHRIVLVFDTENPIN
jgi:hypothetical protein